MTGKFLDAGIHLATCEAFRGEDNGWFRITFATDKETLQTGMQRMVDAIGAKEKAEQLTNGVKNMSLLN